MNLRTTFTSIGNVLKHPAYAILAIVTASLMIVVSTYMLNLPLIASTITASWTWTAKVALLLNLLGGAITNNTVPALALLLLTSLLAGINMTLAVYHWRKQRTATLAQNSATTAGIGTGVLAAGCSSCGISILAMLGLAGTIALLPLKGLEISILSIVILLITMLWLAKTIEQQHCSLPRGEAKR